MTDNLTLFRTRIDSYLQSQFEQLTHIPSTLHTAMHYTVFPGGKRLRPLLTYLTGTAFSAITEALDPAAAAIELIHCYSLVHDDLPAMDNASIRHGQASCHIEFDEATAILVGDALQSLAFTTLCEPVPAYLNEEQHLNMIRVLAHASSGMAGGQMLDLSLTQCPLTEAALEQCYQLKTGLLIRASIQLGAIAAPHINEQQLQTLDQFAQHLGLAFQIQDDLLDATSTTQQLGKPQGQDQATYLQLFSPQQTQQKIDALYQQATNALKDLGIHNTPLAKLTQSLHHRNK